MTLDPRLAASIARARAALDALPPADPRATKRGRCPACERLTTFRYCGLQRQVPPAPPFELWTCSACNSTRSIGDIERGD